MSETTALALRSQFDDEGNLTIVVPDSVTDEERDALAAYLNPSEKLWEHVGEDFYITGVVWYDDFKRDLTGKFIPVIDEDTGEVSDELQRCKTTILLCDTGRLFYTHSDIFYGWVKKTLLPLYGTHQFGRLRKPVHVKIGRTIYRKSGRQGFSPIIIPDTPLIAH